MRFRRVPMLRVQSLDDVAEFAAGSAQPTVLIFDADNTLAAQGAPSSQFAVVVNGVIDRFAAHPNVAQTIVISNGAERGVPRMISRGDKPWTARDRLGIIDQNAHLVVIGDQILTDGILAWRLGATYLQLVIDVRNEGRQQARMRQAGRLVSRLIFRRNGSK